MAFNIDKIFESMESFSKISTKKEYEDRMNLFLSERYGELKELIEAEDTAAASKSFCDGVHEGFKRFGKVRIGDLMYLNYFLIYYIFPAILAGIYLPYFSACSCIKVLSLIVIKSSPFTKTPCLK